MNKPLIAILMGSSNDWEIMQQAARPLHDFGVAYDVRVISAHRSPELLLNYVQEMSEQGIQCFIAGAGSAAHLAGVIAGQTILPVLGVPIPSNTSRESIRYYPSCECPRHSGGHICYRRSWCGECWLVRNIHAGAERYTAGQTSHRIPQTAGRSNCCDQAAITKLKEEPYVCII